MWRREERLKYWLEGESEARKHAFASGLIRGLSSKLRLGQGGSAVRESALTISANVAVLDDALQTTACVKDGLGSFGAGSNHAFKPPAGEIEGSGRIGSAKLLGPAGIRELQLPNERLARIRQEKVEMAPGCRTLAVKFRDADVYELKHPDYQPPQLWDGGRFLVQNPAVHSLTSAMSELPLARTSVRMEALPDAERSGFLREAEALKGIPCDRAELLAVFRHVPIEVISRLRFLEEKKAILYSVSRETKVSRTRLHDMGAIRDVSSREIHLVPHRTRFRLAVLN